MGLSNTRARLTNLYGDDYLLLLEDIHPGVRVLMNLPYRLTGEEQPESKVAVTEAVE